jgi:hypothetical protein
MAKLHLIESRHDIEVAQIIVNELQQLGHTVSWDLNYLVPGEEWKNSLREAIIASDGIIALLTENCVTEFNGISSHISSQWMAADIGAARAYGKFIIPVVLGQNVIIPALVDDIFSIIEPDVKNTREIASKINEATKIHLSKNKEEPALDLPAGYQHLTSAVVKCQKDVPFNKSVFVMMKFPDQASMDSRQTNMLTEIWDELGKILNTYGLTARRADKKAYHDQMWENICVYMLGCRYGIAVLEDRAAKELNPNVTLEYGFMKAMNRNVVLFRDINFKHDRADLTGKLAKSFEIDENGVLNKPMFVKAVQDWLIDEGISPITSF